MPLLQKPWPGNAGSNTVADHIQAVKNSIKQLPKGWKSGRKIMIRTDSAGGTHGFLDWLTEKRRNFSYSVGFTISEAVAKVLPLIPKKGWNRAYDSDGTERDGAWVADITGMLDLKSWPAGMRIIARKEIPHVGAQLRIIDIGGHRLREPAFQVLRRQRALAPCGHDGHRGHGLDPDDRFQRRQGTPVGTEKAPGTAL